MSQSSQASAQQRISDLKVSGHLMTLQTGLFCVFHAPDEQPPTAAGLPGVRISQPPVKNPGNVDIATFDDDGWLGARNGAALIRVRRGPAQIMVTIYQELNTQHEAPRLQVVQLSAQADAPVPAGVAGLAAAGPQVQAPAAPQTAQPNAAPASSAKPEIGAHIQRRGDVAVRLGEWMGQPGSHAWIEGFGVSPAEIISPADIEYQAVLGKGWLSPWVEGGQYCGSRGMALPILGLCIRLKGQAAQKFACRVTATFTDGTKIGPVESGEPIEADTLAPLEAFLLEIVPKNAESSKGRGKGKSARASVAEAAADLAALLEEEVEALEEAEPDDFDLFIEEDIALAEEPAPRKGRGRAKASVKPVEKEAVAPRKAGRPRQATAEKKSAPVEQPATRPSARAKLAASKARAAAAPAAGRRGRKPTSRR